MQNSGLGNAISLTSLTLLFIPVGFVSVEKAGTNDEQHVNGRDNYKLIDLIGIEWASTKYTNDAIKF